MKYNNSKVGGLFLVIAIFVLAGCLESTEDENTEDSDGQSITAEPDDVYPDGEVMDLYLYAENTTLEHLYSRDPNSDDRVNGYIKLDPQSDNRLELDGFRFRGNSARYLPKKSFNIRFDQGQDFLFGSNRMNLNGMYRDPSMMREKISWDMFEELGLPAPRARYFNLYINDRFEGLYVHVERVDEDLLHHHGLNPEGTLVRDRMRNLYSDEELNYQNRSSFSEDVTAMSEPALELDNIFDSRNKPNFMAVYTMLETIQSVEEGPRFSEVFDQWFDVEQFIDWFAVHYLVGDIDAFGDDYWLYYDHEDPDAKWNMIPWDKNLTFGSYTRSKGGVTNDYFHYEYSEFELWENDLLIKFLNTPELMDRLHDRLDVLMTEVFPPEYFNAKVNEYVPLIEEHVLVEPSDRAFHYHEGNHFGELAHYEDRLETITEYINLRYEFIRAQRSHETVEPSAYEASRSDFQIGERTYFTDETGFVMGYVVPEVIEGNPEVAFRIDENADISGIDRNYQLSVENGTVQGEWAFYYRNDIGWLSKGNWYQTEEPVGRQYQLTVNKDGKSLQSTANPYVNRVVTNKELVDTRVIQLMYKEEYS